MYLDSSVIITAITNDHKTHSPIAQKLIKKYKGNLKTTLSSFAEVFYVLESKKLFPNLNRNNIGEYILNFVVLSELEFEGSECIYQITELYKSTKLDIEDIILFAVASNNEQKIASFDKDFDLFDENIRIES